MTAQQSIISILDPTDSARTARAQMAMRPDTLDGKRVGLLDNRKQGGAFFLDAMEELLAGKYKVASFERGAKPDVSRPCPAPIAEDLARRCDVLITALGD